MTQHTLELPGAELVYDVHGPLPTADGRPPLMMIGQPMDASGFQAQVALFDDRTVVTYDPRASVGAVARTARWRTSRRRRPRMYTRSSRLSGWVRSTCSGAAAGP